MGTQIPAGGDFVLRAQFIDQLNQPLPVSAVAVTVAPIVTGTPDLTTGAVVDLSVAPGTLPVGNYAVTVSAPTGTALGDYLVTWTATGPDGQPCLPATEIITLVSPVEIGGGSWVTLAQAQSLTGLAALTQDQVDRATNDITLYSRIDPTVYMARMQRHPVGKLDCQVLATATAWQAAHLASVAADGSGSFAQADDLRSAGINRISQQGIAIGIDTDAEPILGPKAAYYLKRLSKNLQRFRVAAELERENDLPRIYADALDTRMLAPERWLQGQDVWDQVWRNVAGGQADC